jgi:predicted transposase/invertase (TIGR01784 family)
MSSLAGRKGFADIRVLREYLSNREKEVVSIMMALFDQEKAMEQFGYEKMQEGRINQAKKTASNMLKRGLSLNEVAEILELPVETIRSWN